MTIRNLEHAVRPRSVAVFGASTREGSVGRVVIDNIVDGGFEGAILSDVEQQREPFDNYDRVIKIFAEMIKGSQAYRFQCLQGRL